MTKEFVKLCADISNLLSSNARDKALYVLQQRKYVTPGEEYTYTVAVYGEHGEPDEEHTAIRTIADHDKIEYSLVQTLKFLLDRDPQNAAGNLKNLELAFQYGNSLVARLLFGINKIISDKQKDKLLDHLVANSQGKELSAHSLLNSVFNQYEDYIKDTDQLGAWIEWIVSFQKYNYFPSTDSKIASEFVRKMLSNIPLKSLLKLDYKYLETLKEAEPDNPLYVYALALAYEKNAEPNNRGKAIFLYQTLLNSKFSAPNNDNIETKLARLYVNDALLISTGRSDSITRLTFTLEEAMLFNCIANMTLAADINDVTKTLLVDILGNTNKALNSSSVANSSLNLWKLLFSFNDMDIKTKSVILKSNEYKNFLQNIAIRYASLDKISNPEIFEHIILYSPKSLNQFIINAKFSDAFIRQMESIASANDTVKESLARHLFRNHAKLIVGMLLDGNSQNVELKKLLWKHFPQYIAEAFQALAGDKAAEQALKAKIKINCSKQNRLEFKYAMHKIDIANIVELIDCFKKPNIVIAPKDNPIILAAQQDLSDKFNYMFSHKNEEPWATYWLQAGNDDNDIIAYLLRSSALTNDANNLANIRSMINHVTGITSILKNVNYRLLEKMKLIVPQEENLINYRQLKSHLLALLKSSRKLDLANMTSLLSYEVKSWLFLKLAYEKSMFAKDRGNVVGAEVVESAHDNETARLAIKLCNENFNQVLDSKYPESASVTDKMLDADFDLRLLMLKQFLEDKPLAHDKVQLANWKELVKLCGMEQYCAKFEEQGAIPSFSSFAEFREIILSTKNPQARDVSNLLNGKIPPNAIRELLNSKLLAGKSIDSWRAVDPYLSDERRGNFANPEIRKYMLFCMILATENIDKLLSENITPKALYSLIKNSNAAQAKGLRARLEKMFDSNQATVEKDILDAVRNCLLVDQQLMQATFTTEADSATEDRSCETGIYTRYTKQVVNLHYKYSLKNNISEQIQTILRDKLQSFLQEKLLQIYLSRLSKHVSSFSSLKSSLWNRALGSSQTHSLLNKAIYDILNAAKSAHNVFDLTEIVKSMNLPPQTLDSVMRLMFAVKPADNFANYDAVATDKDVQKLFDACFSIHSGNWANLLTGENTLPKYTNAVEGHLKLNGNTYSRRIQLLKQCFPPATICDDVYKELLRLNTSSLPPLTEHDKMTILYYCNIGGAEEPILLNEIAVSLADQAKVLKRFILDTAGVESSPNSKASTDDSRLSSAETSEKSVDQSTQSLENIDLYTFIHKFASQSLNVAKMQFQGALLFDYWKNFLMREQPIYNRDIVIDTIDAEKLKTIKSAANDICVTLINLKPSPLAEIGHPQDCLELFAILKTNKNCEALQNKFDDLSVMLNNHKANILQ